MSLTIRTKPWDDDHRDNFVVVVKDLCGKMEDGWVECIGREYKYVSAVAAYLQKEYPHLKVCIIVLDPAHLLEFLIEYNEDAEELWPTNETSS